MMTPPIAVLIAWAIWLATWVLAMGRSGPTVSRPAPGAERLYTVVVNAGFALLVASAFRALGPRLWSLPPSTAWALVGLAISGFGFCWWARLHLGRTWSWGVTIKQSHRIVDTGPYGLVRHPIYTGVIVAAAATAAIEARAVALAGFAFMVAGLSIKARLEERFLAAELGAATYGAYAARTGMLIPKIRIGTASATRDRHIARQR